MRLVQPPERCLVLLERGEVTAVRWRDRVWTVVSTLEVWTYRGAWWLTVGLEGERREYHVLITRRGEIEVFMRSGSDESLRGWWMTRW